jgi:hypothetical protein
MRIEFTLNGNLHVFRFDTTSNDKIEADKKRKIMQTYTFSKSQFNALDKGMKDFFNSADTNCLDCPFNSFGKCYTHKFNQYVGFKSMLKSIASKYGDWDSIPTYNETIASIIVSLCEGTFVRFGTYGEPSLHPITLIERMASVCDNWTGYTHQWMRHDLGKFFMASVHSIKGQQKAEQLGYRSYIATPVQLNDYVNCPASKEAGYKSSCSKCSLCSGTSGKGNKSIYILNH